MQHHIYIKAIQSVMPFSATKIICYKLEDWKEMTQNVQQGRKEGNVLFNDALNTFYLRLYTTAIINITLSSNIMYLMANVY